MAVFIFSEPVRSEEGVYSWRAPPVCQGNQKVEWPWITIATQALFFN